MYHVLDCIADARGGNNVPSLDRRNGLEVLVEKFQLKLLEAEDHRPEQWAVRVSTCLG